MDKGHKMTDKILEDTEKELNGIYKEAYTTAKQKSSEYLKKFAEKDAIMRKKVDDGEMTEDEYKQWRLGKMIGNSRYKAMAEGLARDMANTNKIAASVINGHLPDVYATNYNWGTYDIEQKSHMNTNFMMYDRQTVERLVRDKPDLLPMKAGVSIPEDMRWNKKQINNAITQGVLLGESIPDIAKRLASVTDMNRKSAIRNARTMTTSAENGGRIDSYKRAEEMGIKITQEWLATNDNRTRHEHMLLNGQEVKIGEPFKVEGYTIRFPADPQAEPFLVYNCRCCLVSNFKGFDYKKMDEYVEEKPMSYEQWEKKHEVAEDVEPAEKPISDYKYAFPDYIENIESNEDYYEEVYVTEFMKMNEKMKATEKERDLISQNYTQSTHSFNINKALRENNVASLTKEEKDTMKALHSAINKNTLDRDIVLTRQVSASAMQNILGFDLSMDDVDDMILAVVDGWISNPLEECYGTIVTEKAFVSTSIVPETNMFTGKYQLKMLVDEGTPIYITENSDESEAVLDYGTKYEIIGAEPYNMFSNITLEEYFKTKDTEDFDVDQWGMRLIVKVKK